MFEKNEGRTDRIARAVVGAGLLACSAWRSARGSGKLLGMLGALTGATLLFTAATGPARSMPPLGIDTSE